MLTDFHESCLRKIVAKYTKDFAAIRTDEIGEVCGLTLGDNISRDLIGSLRVHGFLDDVTADAFHANSYVKANVKAIEYIDNLDKSEQLGKLVIILGAVVCLTLFVILVSLRLR